MYQTRFRARIDAFKYFLLSVLCGLMIVDCAHSADGQSSYSEALIVYPGATSVHFERVQGTEQVAYEITERYPAKRVIDWISDKLRQIHWQPVEYDVLNPGIKSSHAVGWRRFIDGTKGVDCEVYQWLADWKSASGSVVRYEFRYRYPKGSKPELVKVEVFAAHIPASLLKRVQ